MWVEFIYFAVGLGAGFLVAVYMLDSPKHTHRTRFGDRLKFWKVSEELDDEDEFMVGPFTPDEFLDKRVELAERLAQRRDV